MQKPISLAARSDSPGKNMCKLLVVMCASLALLFSAGCATVGQDFPAYRVPDIKVGKTTEKEIRTVFGPPWRVGMEDGQRTWTYGRYRYSLFGETKTKDLVVRFNEQKVVASFTYNTTEHDE